MGWPLQDFFVLLGPVWLWWDWFQIAADVLVAFIDSLVWVWAFVV